MTETNETSFALNSFVRRQTADSRFSHFAGTEDQLLDMLTEHFGNATPGYKPGVCLVSVPAEGFFSGVVELTEDTELKATFEARREGEDAFINVVAVGATKLPAKFVEIVLYSHDELGAEATTNATWEIISINARPTEGDEPMHPIAMMRNMLELTGGNKATYTADEFCKAIRYWSSRAMCG